MSQLLLLHADHRARMQTALVEITPVRPLPLELFSDMKALGRLVLREGGRTLAVGVIVGAVAAQSP